MPLQAGRQIAKDQRYQAAYNQAVRIIDAQLESYSGAAVGARKPDVLASAAEAHGAGSTSYRALRDAWDTIFPQGKYNRVAYQQAMADANL